MKRLVRNTLPVPVSNRLRRAAHARRLDRAPAVAVDVAPLPRAAEVSFPELLRGDGIADGWARARAAIAEVFGAAALSHAMDAESCRSLYYLIRRFQPRSLLEIGTNCGVSTLYAAMAMQEYRQDDAAPRLVTVDLFDVNNPLLAEAQHYGIATPPRELLERLNCAGLVGFAISRSTDYLNRRDGEFDFILMDHAPAADIAYRDLALAIQALRPGGHLLLHPYFPGGKPLRRGERVYPGFYLAVGRAGAGLVAMPCPTADGLNRTSLALMVRE